MNFAGLDIGTTGCKIAVYDGSANLLGSYYQEYDVTRQDGKHEIDFGIVRDGVWKVLTCAVRGHRIDALGVTGFGESFVMLDEEDRILAPSMLYTDPRGEDELNDLCAALGTQTLTLKTGVKPHTMYSIAKMMWVKKHKPDVFSRCKRILLSEDFIIYTLTGTAQIDYSLAARTAAFDIKKRCWIDEVFSAARIDPSLMSAPVPTGSVAGVLSARAAQTLGIDYDMTVVNGAHDQVAGMVGAGVFFSGQAMDGTGTVECIPVVLNRKPTDPGFYDGGYSVVPYLDGSFACYALSFTGGATLKWFRDNFAEEEHKQFGGSVYAELDKRVGDKPTGILILPHFAGAATPYMDSASKAAFTGITLETSKYDLYKALMEGTSFEMLLNFKQLESSTGKIEDVRATGGGASSDIWLQIKADILNTPITALQCREIGALGTAALAGRAASGSFDLRGFVTRAASVRKRFTPRQEQNEQYAALYDRYRNLYRAVKNL